MRTTLNFKRPSTTVLLTAALAAVIAASGTAFAAKLITGAQIANGSLTGADIKENSLTGADIKSGSVSTTDLSGPAKTALDGKDGAQGPKGDTGSKGDKGDKGDKGASGTNGTNGTNGTKGDKGDKGDAGDDALTYLNASGFDAAGFDAYSYHDADNLVVDEGFKAGYISMTGDGISFGPFADSTGNTAASKAAGIRYHGLDSQPITALKSASFSMFYDASDDIGDTHGMPYFRVKVDKAGGDSKVLVAFAPSLAGVLTTSVPLQTTISADDDSETFVNWAAVLADPTYAGATIDGTYGIRVNLGWGYGHDVKGLLRSFEVNGTNYQFSSNG